MNLVFRYHGSPARRRSFVSAAAGRRFVRSLPVTSEIVSRVGF